MKNIVYLTLGITFAMLLTSCTTTSEVRGSVELGELIEESRIACYKAEVEKAKQTTLSGTEKALVVMANALAGIDGNPCNRIMTYNDVQIARARESTKKWQSVVDVITSPLGLGIVIGRGHSGHSRSDRDAVSNNTTTTNTTTNTTTAKGSYNKTTKDTKTIDNSARTVTDDNSTRTDDNSTRY